MPPRYNEPIGMPLTEQQQSSLRAVADRIVPADEKTGPGAVEAGAVEYLLAQLSGDLTSLRDDYQTFLDDLNTRAQSETGTGFADLPSDRQDELLQSIAADPEQGRFFRRVVEHIQEGFYISPISWQMIGWKVTG